ncbi:TPA: TIR domain-containing protein [Salmonella enterica]
MTFEQRIKNALKKLAWTEDYSLEKLQDAVSYINEISPSWSGSWLGYQANVYYENLKTPPSGAVFNKDHGLESPYKGLSEMFGSQFESIGNWIEYDSKQLISYLIESSGFTQDELKSETIFLNQKAGAFKECKDEILSAYYSNKNTFPEDDKFLNRLIDEIEKQEIIREDLFIQSLMPKKIITADPRALNEGIRTPPHLVVKCKFVYLQSIYTISNELGLKAKKLMTHLSNLSKKKVTEDRIGVNVFIGHGRSYLWRELKDFISEKLELPYDEFNRTPTAGLTTVSRLSNMLDNASIAFLVMTAEDEMLDGNKQARMNVIHEVGLFQGRLGFEKAIVLLEEGCEEFSNINGLGQIRFPKGNISAIFHNIRDILEREKILD